MLHCELRTVSCELCSPYPPLATRNREFEMCSRGHPLYCTSWPINIPTLQVFTAMLLFIPPTNRGILPQMREKLPHARDLCCHHQPMSAHPTCYTPKLVRVAL